MISKVENGSSEFSDVNLKKLADFLNTPIEFFINENAISLEDYSLNKKARTILADSKSVSYIVLADKAKAADISPDELERAIDFLISIKKGQNS
jgi:transcriptional regulator with XRE-family HTH domain